MVSLIHQASHDLDAVSSWRSAQLSAIAETTVLIAPTHFKKKTGVRCVGPPHRAPTGAGSGRDPLEHVKTTLERCGPFSLVVLSQRRSQVTPLSGHSDQNASETFSNKLQLNKVQSSLRQTSAKTTQVRSKAKTS